MRRRRPGSLVARPRSGTRLVSSHVVVLNCTPRRTSSGMVLLYETAVKRPPLKIRAIDSTRPVPGRHDKQGRERILLRNEIRFQRKRQTKTDATTDNTDCTGNNLLPALPLTQPTELRCAELPATCSSALLIQPPTAPGKHMPSKQSNHATTRGMCQCATRPLARERSRRRDHAVHQFGHTRQQTLWSCNFAKKAQQPTRYAPDVNFYSISISCTLYA